MKNSKRDFTLLAEACNINPQRLSDILSKRCKAPAEQAQKIVREASALGYDINLEEIKGRAE